MVGIMETIMVVGIMETIMVAIIITSLEHVHLTMEEGREVLFPRMLMEADTLEEEDGIMEGVGIMQDRDENRNFGNFKIDQLTMLKHLQGNGNLTLEKSICHVRAEKHFLTFTKTIAFTRVIL